VKAEELREWVDSVHDGFAYNPGELWDLILSSYRAGLRAAHGALGVTAPGFVNKQRIKTLLEEVDKAQEIENAANPRPPVHKPL
jgi:hypothetical protein